MTPSKASLQNFAAEHFNARRSATLGVSHAARARAAAITTLIVDTDNLVTGQLQFSRLISDNANDAPLRRAAIAALAGHDTAESRLIIKAMGGTPAKIAPIAAPNDIALGSVWHRGEAFESFWIGSAPSIAHYADLTENERERLTNEMRKLTLEGAVVYAVATATSATQPHRYRDVRATFLGLVVFHPTLFAGTEPTVADIHAHGLQIIFASGQPEHIVQSYARASCIVAHHSTVYNYRRGHKLPLDKQLYSHLSAAARQQIIDSYGDSALVVNGSLVDFWQTLKSLRK